jgi:hypothetical protein
VPLLPVCVAAHIALLLSGLCFRMSHRKGLLSGGDDDDTELVLNAGGEEEGHAYGTGHETDNAYSSVGSSATAEDGGTRTSAGPSGSVSFAERLRNSLKYREWSGRQWICVIVSAVIVLGVLGMMVTHRPHPSASHHLTSSSAPVTAHIETSAAVHHTGSSSPTQAGHIPIANIRPSPHYEPVIAHPPSHASAPHHPSAPAHHITVVHEPEIQPNSPAELAVEQAAEAEANAVAAQHDAELQYEQAMAALHRTIDPHHHPSAPEHDQPQPQHHNEPAHEQPHSNGFDEAHNVGLHTPRIVHAHPALSGQFALSISVFAFCSLIRCMSVHASHLCVVSSFRHSLPPESGIPTPHSVTDSIAVLQSGGDRPSFPSAEHGSAVTHVPGSTHCLEPIHGPVPPALQHATAQEWGSGSGSSEVQWFRVTHPIHVWRAWGHWSNGKGADELVRVVC